jgi:2-aminoadipate transaminase
MNHQERLAPRATHLKPSEIRKLVPLMKRPGMISFGGGYPNPQTFALESISGSFSPSTPFTFPPAFLNDATQYGPSHMAGALEPHLLSWHVAKGGPSLDTNQLVVLTGSQEGLFLMAYLFLDHDRWVGLSEPAYPGALGSFGAFTQNFFTWPLDQEGSDLDQLEEKLQAHLKQGLPCPTFFYEVPNGHNPGGVGLSLKRRQQWLSLAKTYDFLILEDDPYELLQLDRKSPLPSLQTLDTEGRVIRLDSFSKIFAPGLRLGYVSGRPEAVHWFHLAKQVLNLHTSTLTQMFLAQYFQNLGPEGLFRHIETSCEFYRCQRDQLAQALKACLGDRLSFTLPGEGMFLWAHAPEAKDIPEKLVTLGPRLGVLAVPGTAFSPTGGLKHYLRLSFSTIAADEMVNGVQRLKQLLFP